MSLINLRELKDDMERTDWTICSFLFQYKKIEYIVLVKRFIGSEKKKNIYALVKLHFMKSRDLKDAMQVEANVSGLLIDAKILRTYFGIEYVNNLGDILQQFTKQLGSAIPTKVPKFVSDIEKRAMVYSLSKSDSEDPSKIYCNKIKINSGERHRSAFNTDKTKLLRKSLFEHFKDEPKVSFCYYDDPTMENDDETILRNFSKGQQRNI